MIMAQTKRLGKQRIRNSAASKKPNITQEIRKGKNTIEAGEAPAAAKRPTVSCQTAYFPLRRIKKGPWYSKALNYTRKNWKWSVKQFTEKTSFVLKPLNWIMLTSIIGVPLITTAVCFANEWVVKSKGELLKIPQAFVNGIHDTAAAIKPVVEWASTNLWLTVVAAVAYIGINAAMASMRDTVASWEKKGN